MKNDLLQKFRMYSSTRNVLTSNEQIWINSLPFKDKVKEFYDYMESIEKKDHGRRSSKSFTKEKTQVFEKMLDVTLIVCSAGAAYAGVINDDKLKEVFNFSKSTLKFGHEKDIQDRCRKIGEEAALIADKLTDYNVSIVQINELTAAAADFYKLIDVPGNVRHNSRDLKQEMIVLFDKCDEILNEIIDKMMLTYKNSHPDFFLEYTNARHIGGWRKKKGDGGDEKNVA